MQILETRPTGRNVAARAYRSVFAAAGRMPAIFIVASVCQAIMDIGVEEIGKRLPMTFTDFISWQPNMIGSGLFTYADFWPLELLMLLNIALQAVVSAPVAVAIHRFILLQESDNGPISIWGTFTRRFAIALIVLQLIKHLTVFRWLFPVHARVFAIIVSLALVALLLWFALILPAIAIDSPSTGWSERMRTAIKQTSGNFWLLFRSLFIVIAPLTLVLIVISIFFVFTQHGAAGAMQQFTSWPFLLLASPLTVFGVSLGAADASWVYAWAARMDR